MKILVVGCGSIGRRHIRNLLSLGCKVAGVELSPEYREWVEKNLKIETYGELNEAINAETPDACFICTPPSTHVALADACIGSGLHVFIEKPVSDSLKGIGALLKKAKSKKLVASVGYNLRFSKGMRKLKELLDSGAIGKPLSSRIIVAQYLPDWRPWQDYRKSYTAKKALGGGVLLDCSHEIDYAGWLLGEAKAVTCVARKVSRLEVETEDNADLIVEFAKGAVANIHMDFVRRGYRRGCEIVGEKGSLELFFWDRIELFDAGTKETRKFDVKEEPNGMYVAEARDFLDCIRKRKEPLVGIEDGKKALEIVLASKESSEKGKRVVLK